MYTKQVFALGVLTLMGLNQFTLVASAAGNQEMGMRARLSSRLEQQEIQMSQDLQAVRDIVNESRGVKGLRDFDSSLEFQGKHARVDIPRNENGRVRLDGDRFDISVSLPDAGSREEGKLIADGVVNFPTDGSFSNAVQALPDGSVRMKTILSDESAPESFEYSFGDSGEYVLTEAVNQDGEKGVAILNTDQTDLLAMVEPAWAKDATGLDLETHFEIRDNVLIQHVSHQDENVQYPVVADPYIWGNYYERYWWGGNLWMKRGMSGDFLTAVRLGVNGLWAWLSRNVDWLVGWLAGEFVGSAIVNRSAVQYWYNQGDCIGVTWDWFSQGVWFWPWQNQYCY